MDEETERRLVVLQQQVNAMAMVLGQCVGLLAAHDPGATDALDDLLAHLDGAFQTPGGTYVTDIIRASHDKMASAARAKRSQSP